MRERGSRGGVAYRGGGRGFWFAALVTGARSHTQPPATKQGHAYQEHNERSMYDHREGGWTKSGYKLQNKQYVLQLYGKLQAGPEPPGQSIFATGVGQRHRAELFIWRFGRRGRRPVRRAIRKGTKRKPQL
jgi:hypothetical protein